MRTKRYISLLLAGVMLLALAGCGANEDKEKDGDMTIRPTQLSEEEDALVELLGLELDQEIPLAIQIATTQSEIHSYDVQYFGMPREYAKYGYEHVYAITVTFSANSVAGDPQDAPSSVPSLSAEPSAAN